MEVQLFLSNATPMPELFVPITNRQFVKPAGGMWTSTYIAEGHTSGWINWCRDEEFGDVDILRWFLLTPSPGARVLTIDSIADMDAMYTCYSDYSLSYAYLNMIDFEAMARDYDAMRITARGQWATRLCLPRNLYGWDCESTCWFRWSFTKIKEVSGGVLR